MNGVPSRRAWAVVLALGVTQIVAWGSIYYAFSLLIQPLATAAGTTETVVVGAFSVALLLTGIASAPVGALIDRIGGRWVMTAGSLAAAALLAVLPSVRSVAALYLVWAGLGIVMAATLYDPAFAVLAQVFREGQRQAITALTLFGGFASTVFWPLTQALIAGLGWRDAVFVLAAMQLVICVPLHALVVPGARAAPAQPHADRPRAPLRRVLADPAFYGLAAAFTGNAFVFSAMSVHMLGLLHDKGLSPSEAAWIGAMIGPMQVLGRVLEYAFLRHASAARVGVIAIWLLPLSLGFLLAISTGAGWFAAFALLYGTGNGVMTIVRGAMPRELYGTESYGAVNGALATPVVIAKAAGPISAALVVGSGNYPTMVAILAALAAIAAGIFTWTTARSRRAALAVS